MADDVHGPLAWMTENGPRDDEEAHAAAVALVRQRDLTEDLDLLERLTPFERELADRAAEAERHRVLEAVKTAVGSAAETVNATALRHALSHISDGRADFGPLKEPVEFSRGMRTHHKAARIVASAHRAAEHQEREASRLRIAPFPEDDRG